MRRLQLHHPVDRTRHCERVAIAVAANGDEIREVSEEAAEEVPGDTDLVLRKPDHQRVGCRAPRNRVQLDINLKRFDSDMSQYPTTMRIFEACMKLDAFQRAQPSAQPDAE